MCVACKSMYLLTQAHYMAESYSRPLESDDENFIQTSALYAVRSEISLRGVIPQVKQGRDTEYIQIWPLKIFVGYCVMNDDIPQEKNLQLPAGDHHACVIRLRYGMDQWFMILTPKQIWLLHLMQYITQKNNDYLLNLTFTPDREIILDHSLGMKKFLEKWHDLLAPYRQYCEEWNV